MGQCHHSGTKGHSPSSISHNNGNRLEQLAPAVAYLLTALQGKVADMRTFLILFLLMVGQTYSTARAEKCPGGGYSFHFITKIDPKTGEEKKEFVETCIDFTSRFRGDSIDALTKRLEEKRPKSDVIYPVYRCKIDEGGGCK